MKKLCLVLLITLFLFAGCDGKKPGVSMSVPPSVGTESEKLKIHVSSEITGFGTAFSSLLAEEMGMEVKFTGSNEADASLICTEKADQNIAGVIIENDCVIIALTDSDINGKADLAGKFIGIGTNEYTSECLKKDVLYGEIVDGLIGYNNLSDALNDIDSGRLNAVIADRLTALELLKDKEQKYKISEDTFAGKCFSFVVKDEELREKTKSSLSVVVKSEDAIKVSEKWFGKNVFEDTDL